MKCQICGRETGAKWKKLCLDCWKKQKSIQEDKNMKESYEEVYDDE